MNQEDKHLDEMLDRFGDSFIAFVPTMVLRLIRSAVYFLVSALLLWASNWGVSGGAPLCFAIALLGLTSASARIAQLSILILAVVAVIPKDLVSALVG